MNPGHYAVVGTAFQIDREVCPESGMTFWFLTEWSPETGYTNHGASASRAGAVAELQTLIASRNPGLGY